MDENGVLMIHHWKRKAEAPREKRASLPLIPPQITHGTAWGACGFYCP
jgi:hypothetical protein